MNTLLAEGTNAVEIAQSIERRIRSGELAVDQLLPSVRTLAASLGVSANTVAAAFKALRDAGLVSTDGRRGTRISGNTIAVVEQAAIPEGLRDLASGNVDSALLPELAAHCFAELSLRSGHEAQTDTPQLVGLAKQWFESQGLPAQAVGIFSGALDAIERALRTRCRPGNKVLVEDPCWPPVLALLNNLGLKAVPMPLDEAGAQVPPLQLLQNAAAVILTPRAQNPSGRSFTAQRWRQWSHALAQAPELLVVIDDHWGPLSSACPPCPNPLPGVWVCVLSTSKFLGPDLRVSVATGSLAILAPMQRQQALGPRWVSLILQKLAARLWQSMLDQQAFEQVRMAYAARRTALAQSLQAQGFALDLAGEGLHVWLPVSDETAMVQALAARGWAIQPGTPFRLASPPAVRISLANLEAPAELAGDLACAFKAPRRAVY